MPSSTPALEPIRPGYRLRILQDDQLEALRTATLEILDSVGVHCPSARARAIYRQHGAEIDEATEIVHLPPDLVLQAMAKAPRHYVLGARSPDHDAVLDGTAMYVATDGCGVETIDFDTRQRRPSRKEDVGLHGARGRRPVLRRLLLADRQRAGSSARRRRCMSSTPPTAIPSNMCRPRP